MTRTTAETPDLDELRRAAEGATPGEWRIGIEGGFEDQETSCTVTVTMPYADTGITCYVCDVEARLADRAYAPQLALARNDAAHIAAWCPANALSVLNLVDDLRDRLAKAEAERDEARATSDRLATTVRFSDNLANELRARAQAAEAERDAMREALRPFVSGFEKIPPYASDDTRATLWLKPARGHAVTIGDVRRAAALVDGQEAGRG